MTRLHDRDAVDVPVGHDPCSALIAAGFGAGELLAVALADGVGLGLAFGDDPRELSWSADDPAALVGTIEESLGPRWVWWSNDTAAPLVRRGVRVARCWDVAAAHRLIAGGHRADAATVWAALHDRPTSTIPSMGQLGLLDDLGEEGDDPEDPCRPDGHLRPEWAAGAWSLRAERLARWAATALLAQHSQAQRIADLGRAHPAMASTAHSESAAELLAVELSVDGLPVDRRSAQDVIGRVVGPRATTEDMAQRIRAKRDAEVLRHAPLGGDRDLRNPAHVRDLLRRVGIDVPDTRAWRLEPFRGVHPLVDALLSWRKAERVATTYGYAWLDHHVGDDGRLRGEWSACDGAAGRMTAGAGLHNMPVDMRDLVAAEPGHVFVRADLGQIEPRVLAAVSGDAALARATQSDDLYAPVAAQLGVERNVAKVAVLAAMYGQTSGTAGQALHGLERAYPIAMGHLRSAADAAQRGEDLRTYGGRRVKMSSSDERVVTAGLEYSEDRRITAARGRYGRNAVIQGAAAELFKAWAVTFRARVGRSPSGIVLCLHDELLVHVRRADAEPTAELVLATLDEAAYRWAPDRSVRFVADVSIVERWSQAK